MTFLEACWHLNNLATRYRTQGQYAKAEPLFKRSLAIREKALGPEHPDLAKSLDNLVALYNAQGQYAKAEPLYQRSLAIFEKALGPEHPDVATSLNNLAELYRAQGQYAKAEPLYQRSLAIGEKALGPEHPDLAQSLDNLVALYNAQGQYAKAEPLYQRALAIWEKALGPEHPNVATRRNKLAEFYRTQGQYAKAERLYQRSLAILEKALGPEHPDVANSLNNLAALYNAQGQYAKAEPLLRRVLAIFIDSVEQKKAQLDRARPLPAVVVAQLQKHYDINLTDTSNAIEDETALLIEHAMVFFAGHWSDDCTFADNYEAVQWMRELATQTAPIDEGAVCDLNRRIGTHHLPPYTGLYRQGPGWIEGSPEPAEIFHLMAEFDAWLKTASPVPAFAFEAHFRLTAIHPFDDGNGRTARLLMNLLLIRGGYPPAPVGVWGGRKTYFDALKHGSRTGDLQPFQFFMHKLLDATLREYLTVLQEALPQPEATAHQTGPNF